MKNHLSGPELLNVFEGLIAGEVVDHDDAMCAFVVRTGDGAESFLACSIPDLQFDLTAVDGKRSR